MVPVGWYVIARIVGYTVKSISHACDSDPQEVERQGRKREVCAKIKEQRELEEWVRQHPNGYWESLSYWQRLSAWLIVAGVILFFLINY